MIQNWFILSCAVSRRWSLFNIIFVIFPSTQGKSDRINLEQFVNFMNEKQRDPRLNEILYPLYDEKRALEIITTYELSEEAKNDSERITLIPWTLRF